MATVQARRIGVAVVAAMALLLPASAAAETVVIKVVSVTMSGKLYETKPKGPSKGDRLVLTSRLLNAAAQFGKARGAQVGTDSGTITFRSHTAIVIQGVAHLPDGTIRFKGKGTVGSNDPIRVTGGTGRYSGAHGTLIVGPGDRPLNTYRLTLPLVA